MTDHVRLFEAQLLSCNLTYRIKDNEEICRWLSKKSIYEFSTSPSLHERVEQQTLQFLSNLYQWHSEATGLETILTGDGPRKGG